MRNAAADKHTEPLKEERIPVTETAGISQSRQGCGSARAATGPSPTVEGLGGHTVLIKVWKATNSHWF